MLQTLILIPTSGEQQILRPRLASCIGDSVRVELCGFGPVAAAARTSQLIAALQPARILLVGIAGSLDRELAPGHAAEFEHVAMYGIGAGTGDTYRNAGELGWPHWTATTREGGRIHVGDRISLQQTDQEPDSGAQLLTVCAAAATQKDVRDRLAKFPDARAEDMEGFSVAFAGGLGNVPVRIIRGISNVAGDRDKARWRITDALHAAADLVAEILS
ncbi:MAG: futalosine hydrolase [Fuerstiella sp.]